jgi:hypothetical protein
MVNLFQDHIGLLGPNKPNRVGTCGNRVSVRQSFPRCACWGQKGSESGLVIANDSKRP